MDSLTLLRITCVFCACALTLAPLAVAEDMNGPPARPEVFRNPQELRDYLKALNEYFAIVGRPRFGRSVSKRSSLATLVRRFGSPTIGGYDLDGNGVITTSELEYLLGYSK